MIYCHNYIYMNTKLSISCGEGTPTLRTSQDITTYIYIYTIMTYWQNNIYMNTKLSVSCGAPHTLNIRRHYNIYIYLENDLLTLTVF